MSGVAVDESGEPQAQRQAAEARNSRQKHQRPAQRRRTTWRRCVCSRSEQGQIGNRRGQAQLEQGLGPPEVPRLANAELHQPSNPVLDHLASASSFIEGWTGLQFACLLEQSFLRVDVDRPSGVVRLVSAVRAEDAPEGAMAPALAGSRNRGDFAPSLPLLLHQLTVGACRETMPSRAEVIADGAEGLQEPLRLLAGLEALHAALPLTCRQMRILRSVVQPLVTSVFRFRQRASKGRWVTREFVGDDHPRRACPPPATASAAGR
jgi:hypothetical protein